MALTGMNKGRRRLEGTELPNAFCWTKMGDDASQTLDIIKRRKDYERLYGDSQVWWGVGESLHKKVNELRQRSDSMDPVVVFTPQLTRPKKGNYEVVVWRDFLDGETQRRIPSHALVLSAARKSGGGKKSKYYALVCRCELSLVELAGNDFFPESYRNLGSEKERVGASQVTAIVERNSDPLRQGNSRYKIHIRASLVSPYFVTLANPRTLTEVERRKTDDAGTDRRVLGRDEWIDLVRSVRQDS